MNLKDYLKDNKVSVSQFSKLTDIPEDTINKYKYGLRIPQRDQMIKIFETTQGTVDPNSFYLDR